jgi:hypothetical protein
MEDLEGLNFNISISGNANQTQSTESQNTSTTDETWGGWVTDEKPKDDQSFESIGDSTKQTSMSSDEFAHNRASFTEGLFATANNPVACMFHVGFKAASICSFLFLNAILGEEILTFIIVVLFAAVDFWTVKNVTGRILVNLRWWSEIDEWGNE